MKSVLFILLSLNFLTACTETKLELKKNPYSGGNPLAATRDQLLTELQQKGDLEGVQTSSIDNTYEVIVSKSDTQYFVKNGNVVSFIRSPTGDETKLIYWRYKFKDQLYRDQEVLNDGQLGHHAPMRQLACDNRGIGVTYDPNSEAVKRVFYYDNR